MDFDIAVQAGPAHRDQCAAFLRSALEADSPVAWLNLHSGEAEGLDDWHWVTVIGLEEHSDGPLLCTVLDGGREITVDFRLWFRPLAGRRTRGAGGGLSRDAGVAGGPLGGGGALGAFPERCGFRPHGSG